MLPDVYELDKASIKLKKDGLVKLKDKHNTFFVNRTNGIQIEYSVLDSLFYAQQNSKKTTTVHLITLPPSTGERSEDAQGVRSKRKDFKDVQKERKEKNAQSAPLSL